MAQRQLGKSSEGLSRTYERLASGMRINRASDDAAGLAMATRLESDALVFGQGIRNINEGISAINIAEGALNELTSVAQRLQELSSQSANGIYTFEQRKALQLEADALVNEFNRILESTQYNRRSLLDPASQNLSIQMGAGSNNSLALNFTSELDYSIGTGLGPIKYYYDTSSIAIASDLVDFNGDGILDLATADNAGALKMNVLLGNSDGSFRAPLTTNLSSAANSVAAGDVNGDGFADVVTICSVGIAAYMHTFLGNGNGTFRASISASVGTTSGAQILLAEDLNSDNRLDVVLRSPDYGFTKIFLGTQNGDFSLGYADSTILAGSRQSAAAADFNADGLMDFAVSDLDRNIVKLYLNQGGGTFSFSSTASVGAAPNVITTGDVNRDGYADLISLSSSGIMLSLGNGNGSLKAPQLVSAAVSMPGSDLALYDTTGDGLLDIVYSSGSGYYVNIFRGDGAGSFTKTVSVMVGTPNMNSLIVSDFNGDGAADVGVNGPGSTQILLATTTATGAIPFLNLFTQSDALTAM